MNPDQDSAPPDAAGQARWRFADVEFDETDGSLRVAGKPVVVEPRPLRLLLELLRHVNEVVTKEELQGSVWEGRPTVDHVLANAVSKLRTALGEAGAARLITVPRVGYRLAGPVQRLAARAPEVLLQAGQPVPGRDGYLLERTLGEGAHSDVWLARHAKLGHAHVFKFATDGPRLSALKREYTLYRVLAQELGPRDDFARVLDTNFVAAPYFIECAFGGQSLLEWAEDNARLAGMSTQARLDLFVQIARAVAAAHSVGVLHKDLKPGNVLVQADSAGDKGGPGDQGGQGGPGGTLRWQARLTDFGSGRLLDLSRLDGLHLTAVGMTQTQSAGADSRSGTLLYMAPELMAGQAPTVQSDVYALGMLLWQMLVGDLRRPLATSWQRELPDDLLQDDVMAATEARPEDRLTSAAELADRVSRLPERRAARNAAQAQARLAVEAASQLQKARARRPWVIGAVASLALGLLGSVVFGVQSRAALRQSEQQTLRAEAINSFLNEDVLAASELGRGRSGRAVTLVDVLARASQAAAERFRDQPETEATVRLQLAQTQAKLRNMNAAGVEYERALTLWARLKPADHPQRLLAQFGMSSVYFVLTRTAEAQALLDEGQRQLRPALAKANPRVAFAAARAQIDGQVAARDFKAALAGTFKLQELADGAATFSRDDRVEARLLQAEMHYQLSDMPSAAKVLQELSQAPFNIADAGPVLRARALIQGARQDTNNGDVPAAEAKLLRARDGLLDSVGETDFYTGIVLAELADLYSLDRPRQAAQALDAALLALRASLGPDHLHVRTTVINKAFLELDFGDVSKALAQLDAQRPWFAAQPGKGSQQLVQAIDFRRATALTLVGRAAEALPVLDGIDDSALAQASWGNDWPLRLKAERGLALLGIKRRDEGLKLLAEAVQGMKTNCYSRTVCDGYGRQLARAGAATGS